MGYCQEEAERHQIQQYRRDESLHQSSLGLQNTSAVPQADK